jgi:hypothetical protein
MYRSDQKVPTCLFCGVECDTETKFYVNTRTEREWSVPSEFSRREEVLTCDSFGSVPVFVQNWCVDHHPHPFWRDVRRDCGNRRWCWTIKVTGEPNEFYANGVLVKGAQDE